MHLKPPPKLVRSELHLDASGIVASQCSSLFVRQQAALLKTLAGNHSNSGTRRLPFSIISTNTLHHGSPADGVCNRNSVTAGQPRVPPRPTLMLCPSLPSCENSAALSMTEDATDAALNMWTVIRPGHVREKIALFASEQQQVDDGSEHNATGSCGTTRMPRLVKAKGTGKREDNSTAKRRRRSANHQNLRHDQETPIQDEPPPTVTPETETVEAESKVSVVEMVAFLELRASEQQTDWKPALAIQRSSASITLSRAMPPEVRGEEPEKVRGEAPMVREEEPEKVRVSEMVAKLEECGRREGGALSRSSSLRTVGRVLLAAATDHGCTPPRSAVTSSMTLVTSSVVTTSSSSLAEALSRSSQPQRVGVKTPPLSLGVAPPLSGDSQDGWRDRVQTDSSVTVAEAPPHQCEEAEPPPGLLFLTPPPAEKAAPPHFKTSFYLEPVRSFQSNLSPPCDSVSQSEEKAIEGVGEVSAVPLSRSPSASQDFLALRERLQRLLAPPPYLLVLPHHLLVQILALLPTRSLAALKCCCSYFRVVIDAYAVRPADSLWVCDPRYRDDPCKQCKRRYEPGDVSLCRWHHKPYCQALPYGPGFWMCCHGARRDAPGCNVGLHDNRWVPAFHSINVPIYRRSCNHDD